MNASASLRFSPPANERTAPLLRLRPAPFIIRDERLGDAAAREELLEASFGRERLAKTCERLREGRCAAPGLSFVAEVGPTLVGTLRLWEITAADRRALLLGPLAVDHAHRRLGIAAAMMEHALRHASRVGHRAVLLVGDEPYYRRFGFQRRFAAGLELPGPVEAARFLGLELAPGALVGSVGRVVATGALQPALETASLAA